MEQKVYIILVIIGSIIILTSYFSKVITRSFFSEPMVAMLIGFGLNVSNSSYFKIIDAHGLLDIITRFTLAIALISTAFQMPHKNIKKYRKEISLVVVLGMIGMWILSSIIVFTVFRFEIHFCLLLGAILTPTDPVVISSIVSSKIQKKMIPEHIRNIISFESGANDGLAFLFVMLPFLLIIKPVVPAIMEFIGKVFLIENIAGIILATALGYIFGKLLHYFHKKGFVDERSMLGFSIAMTFFIFGLAEILHLNSIIAVFTAGVATNSVISESEHIEEEKMPDAMERLFVIPGFFLFGLIAPYKLWIPQIEELSIMLVLIILFKRIPVLLALKPLIKRLSSIDLLLIGWFGPIGIAALFYTSFILFEHGFDHLWMIVSYIVFGSTIIHGITRFYISKWYSEESRKQT